MRFVFHALLLVLLTAPAFAGTLFPPANSAKNGVGIYACADKSALVWSTDNGGSLKCTDTSSMVTIASCPAGQVLTGVTNGVPTCIVPPSNNTLNISCPAGQVLSGISNGSAVCTTASTSSTPSTPAAVTASCQSNYVLSGINNGVPVCIPFSAITVGFGGLYGVNWGQQSRGSCYTANPVTGGCSCPAGYRAAYYGATVAGGMSPFAVGLFMCYK